MSVVVGWKGWQRDLLEPGYGASTRPGAALPFLQLTQDWVPLSIPGIRGGGGWPPWEGVEYLGGVSHALVHGAMGHAHGLGASSGACRKRSPKGDCSGAVAETVPDRKFSSVVEVQDSLAQQHDKQRSTANSCSNDPGMGGWSESKWLGRKLV